MTTLEYIFMKHNERYNKKEKSDYDWRQRGAMFMSNRGPKWGCKVCNFITKSSHSKCPNCGFDMMLNLGYKARPPKKNASKRKWADFWRMFG